MAMIDGCAVPKAKQFIIGILEREMNELDDGAKDSVRKTFLEQIINEINHMPECGAEAKSKKVKKPRKKSAYNEFISVCMKKLSGPVTQRMRSCADEWKERGA